VFLGYRWFDSKKDIEPLFPFGFGLSYTTFEYSDIKVSAPDHDGNITATATIKNTGKVAGAEVVQLYVQPPAATVPRPVRELKGFTRLELQPGESKTATITFPRSDLAYWDPATKKWTVTPGAYIVSLGGSSRQLPLQANLKL
jgi:beta-glucosidase